MSDAPRPNLWGWWMQALWSLAALDGGVSILRGLAWGLTGSDLLRPLVLLGLLPILALLPGTCLVACITPRIPLRGLVPILMVWGWASLGAFPLFLWWSFSAWRPVVVGVIQLLAVGLAMGSMTTMKPGQGWRYTVSRWSVRQAFSWKRSLALVTVVGLGFFIGLPTYGLGMFSTTVSWGTGGYATIGLDGMRTTERVLVKDSRTVHLVGMVHIGTGQAYGTLLDRFESFDGRTVVLAEGVSDDGGTHTKSSYKRTADRIGLVSQPPIHGDFDTVNADVRLSEIPEETRTLIEAAVRVWSAEDQADAAWRYYQIASKQKDTGKLIERLIQDLGILREERLFEVFLDKEPHYDHLVMPWGAIHLDRMQDRLEAHGYVLQSERSQLMIPWSTFED